MEVDNKVIDLNASIEKFEDSETSSTAKKSWLKIKMWEKRKPQIVDNKE